MSRKMFIDLYEDYRPPILCAILIMVYNRLADEDAELARQMAEDLPGFRFRRHASDRAAGQGLSYEAG